MNNIHYIYSLDCPETGVPKYIGKTNNLKERYKSHLKEKGNTKKITWIKSLKSKGLKPLITVLDIIDGDWVFWESHYISLYKSWGFELKNMTNGGEGLEMNMEIIKKLSIARKGKTYEDIFGKEKADEMKKYLRENVSHLHTPDVRIKISKSLTGRKTDPEVTRKQSEKRKGIRPKHFINYRHSEETKIKISKLSKGRKVSDETRKKMSDRMKGSKHESLRKKVVQISLSGEIIKIWDALREAARELKISHGQIGGVCKGKRKTCKGYIWKYEKYL